MTTSNTNVIYAKSGEILTCINGHEIARLARDIIQGQYYEPGMFVGWSRPEPEIGQKYAPCLVCGGRWWFGNESQHLHFKDGWR